jgi:hypothetical protein
MGQLPTLHRCRLGWFNWICSLDEQDDLISGVRQLRTDIRILIVTLPARGCSGYLFLYNATIASLIFCSF